MAKRFQSGDRVESEFGTGTVVEETGRSLTYQLDSGETLSVVVGTPGYFRVVKVETYTTSTHWNVTVNFETQTGTVQWKDDATTRNTFEVRDYGMVIFPQVGQTPHDVVSDVQRWVKQQIGLG